MKIYDFKSCREFTRAQIKNAAKGYQNQLAVRCGIHPSYFSRYLSEQVGLTRDHGFGLSKEWGLSREETRFLMLLLDLENAVTVKLQQHLKEEIEEMIETYDTVGAQVTGEQVFLGGDAVYYSNWYYSVIHLLLTIPKFQSEKTIGTRLQWPIDRVAQCLRSLEALGLVEKKGSGWVATKKNIHLKNTEGYASQQHRNWRVHTAERVSFMNPQALHFSAVHSISENDFLEIKKILQQTILNVDRRVRPSKEEDVFFFGVDFYRV